MPFCTKRISAECRERNGIWPRSGFDRKKGGCGITSHCKECRHLMAREYKKRNRAAMTAYLRKWQQAHPGRTQELRRAHYLRNLKKARAYASAWKKKNPILHRSYQRLRYIAIGNGHHLNDIEWKEVLAAYGKKCLCCGTAKDITVDHIIPVSEDGSDTQDNVQPLCRSCNSSKKRKRTDYRPDKGKKFNRPVSKALVKKLEE